MHTAKSTILLILLVGLSLSWKHYKARVVVSEKDSDSSTSWEMLYQIDSRLVPRSSATAVRLYNMDIDPESCRAKTYDLIPNFYAAFVKIPGNCSQIEIVKELERNGADFIFLSGEGSQEQHKLVSNGLTKPVFILSNTESNFSSLVARKLPIDKDEKNRINKAYMTIQINFPSPMSKGSKAKVQFFYSPANELSYDFIEELGKVYDSLRDHMDFSPVVSLFRLGIENPNCISDGLYCAMDPDGETGLLTGRDVVNESLFEKCVNMKAPADWFTYMRNFKNQCRGDMSIACSKTNLKKTNLSYRAISDCIESSFRDRTSSKGYNSILEKEIKELREENPTQIPSLFINGSQYQGHPKYGYIASAICDTLKHKPEICQSIQRSVSVENPDEAYYWRLALYLYLIGASLLFTAIFCITYQRSKYNSVLDKEVKKRIDNYYMMRETTTESHGLN